MSHPEVYDVAVRAALDYRARVAAEPAFPRASADDMRRALGGPLPETGQDASTVIADLVRNAEPGLVASAGPRYFGFVIGGSLPVTVAADWLVSAWDQNGSFYMTSPVSGIVEEVAARWIIQLLGLPVDAGVGFVTGGCTANFTCLAAARHAVLQQVGWDVEQRGLIGAPRILVVASEQTHTSVFLALRMLGLGVADVVRVPADDQGRLWASALERALEARRGPAIVCAQVGNVNSGACDPLEPITRITRARGAWLHVDGAFGLWAAVSPAHAQLLAGVAQADSWAVDAHKWLNVPYDCGIAICANAAAHRAAMAMQGEYLMKSEGAARDNFDWTPEMSRRARGFTVYAAIRHLGRAGIRALVERCCDHARLFADLLRAHPDVEILNDVVLNQVLVRFGNSDEVTRDVIARVQQTGTCWMGGTTWRGEAAMRISVSSWATTREDIERSATCVLAMLAG